MYNLLIVDDEPVIVNGLYEQFLDWREEDLSVYRAYSATEALRIMFSTKIDIVLSDIQMPGMNGIELQKKIHELWPRCKIIFLSGYSDFEYIQSAMRDGGLDYILKVEGDEPIFAAVGKAISRLKDEIVSEELIRNARERLEASLPMLQRDYLAGLIRGELPGNAVNPERFLELNLPLSCREQVLLAVGRIDRWPKDLSPRDRSLLMYAVQNISEEYFGPLTTVSIPTSTSRIAWLIQPAIAPDGAKLTEDDWEKCFAFVSGTISDIQETCKSLLNLPVSIALSGRSCEWRHTAAQYLRLEELFQTGFGSGEEMLLSERYSRAVVNPGGRKQQLTKQDIVLRLRSVKQLEVYLSSGQKHDYFELFREIADSAREMEEDPSLHPFLVELECSLTAMFLSYLNQRELLKAISALLDTSPLLQRSFASWKEAEAYFARLSDLLFTRRADDQQNRTLQLQETVNQYIQQHLAEDLSLDRLANQVHLHPTYLSRLYKQITGIRLSEYIKSRRLESAKELLAQSRLKIHEIAVAVGFESAHYFTKVFKKEVRMTPQEYRERYYNSGL